MDGGYNGHGYQKKKKLVALIFSFASVNIKQGETC